MRISVTVPATTANLGPGFDALGLALDICNRVRAEPARRERVQISGFGVGELPEGPDNLMLQAARALADAAGRRLPPMSWRARNAIPLSSGLGSSSAAIVAGLLVANAALGLGWPRRRLLELAAKIEGHPDNVAPALLGGLVICLPESRPLVALKVPVHPELRAVLFIPETRVSTEQARRALPKRVPLADAVFNLARTAAVAHCLREGLWRELAEAMRDRLHQPYRARFNPGMEEMFGAALDAGAAGAALSGSGPTIVAFAPAARACSVAQAMDEQARQLGLAGRVIVARPRQTGASVRIAE